MFAAMLGDVVQSLFKKPVTELYPFKRYPTPARLRGKLVYDTERCTGCQLCVKDCPAGALKLIVVNKEEKRFVMRYYVDRCTYCGQCVESCHFNCLSMPATNWELAGSKRQPFVEFYGRKEDVQAVLAP